MSNKTPLYERKKCNWTKISILVDHVKILEYIKNRFFLTDSIFGIQGIIFDMCAHTKFQDDLLNNIQNIPEKLLSFRHSPLKFMFKTYSAPCPIYVLFLDTWWCSLPRPTSAYKFHCCGVNSCWDNKLWKFTKMPIYIYISLFALCEILKFHKK